VDTNVLDKHTFSIFMVESEDSTVQDPALQPCRMNSKKLVMKHGRANQQAIAYHCHRPLHISRIASRAKELDVSLKCCYLRISRGQY
jgi:hypothetical protein